ncbi:MAG: hypothetical protein RBS07_15375 [Lentimicrobium sp.]|jgi:hypothetical protein|nr:hypothetical protein [Lentimicrobium sp.]
MKIIKWPKWYIALSMIFVVAFFIYNYESPSSVRNEKFKQDLSLSLKGLLIDKYIDYENHEYKTCIIQENIDILRVLLNFDQSGLFNYLQVGDSVFKIRGDSLIIAKRGTDKKHFYLRY